jgi:hypothetical protein
VFLNNFLANSEVKVCRLIPVYFKSKAVSNEDKIAIENLALVLAGKDVKKISKTHEITHENSRPIQPKPAPRI